MKQPIPNRRATVSRALTASAPDQTWMWGQEMLSKEVISKPNCAPEAFTSGFQTCQAGTEEEAEQCLPCIHLTAPVSPAVGAGQNQRKPPTNERAPGNQKGETGAVDVVAKTDDG